MAPTTNPSLNLIVAATVKNGIGRGGELPWPMLRKEMAYFARVTKRVPAKVKAMSPAARNVVIMGRKTWDSIPPKLRPLRDRTNVIITRQDSSKLGISSPDVIVASSIEEGISKVTNSARSGQCPEPGRYFVIGGSSIYGAALSLPCTKYILLTRIRNEYECDTYFPVDLDPADGKEREWQQGSTAELQDLIEEAMDNPDMEETVNEDVHRYTFCLYKRV